ncbi:hypothetical protein M569_02148, partial [Genlisea aurea]
LFLLSSLAFSFMAIDPLNLSPLAGHDFVPVQNDIAPYIDVMNTWPWDNTSRLGLLANLEFKDQVFGPESLEFDILGRGPYSGLADGTIARWMGPELGWETFALVTPNWSRNTCATGVHSTTYTQWKVEPQCGRPLGLRFDRKTGDLYIADAYYGLLVVGPEGGLAIPLSNNVHGKPLLFANDLDIHPNGSIFFTDTSARYNRANHFFILLEGEATGRLLRYDPPTKTTHVVLEGLAFPNGVQFSKDYSFILLAETTNCRIVKYFVEGPKMGRVETLVNLPGFPDNIRRRSEGELYWVAIDCCRTAAQELLVRRPWMRSVYFRLPIPMRYLARMAGMRMYTMIALVSGEGGEIVDALEDKEGQIMKLVSEVREFKGKLWIGTVAHNHISTL